SARRRPAGLPALPPPDPGSRTSRRSSGASARGRLRRERVLSHGRGRHSRDCAVPGPQPAGLPWGGVGGEPHRHPAVPPGRDDGRRRANDRGGPRAPGPRWIRSPGMNWLVWLAEAGLVWLVKGWLFWLSVGLVAYTYVGYPLVLWLITRWFPRDARKAA